MPLKRYRFNKYKCKKADWITTGIIKSIKFRDNLYRCLKRTPPTDITFLNMKHNLSVYNKILKRLIREAKAEFYNNKFKKCHSDSKETWKTVNSVLNKTKKDNLPETFYINNENISNKNVLVNNFNSYFGEIGEKTAATIPTHNDCSFTDYLNAQINYSFSFKLVSNETVKNVINNMKPKNSSGHDGISMKLLKYLELILYKPITLLVNQSLKTGIFPERMKIAKIIPIYKKIINI